MTRLFRAYDWCCGCFPALDTPRQMAACAAAIATGSIILGLGISIYVAPNAVAKMVAQITPERKDQ